LKLKFLEKINSFHLKFTSLLKFIIICICFQANAQTATIKGIIFDEQNIPIPSVDISFNGNGTSTNENGFYILQIPANKKVTLKISFLGMKSITTKVQLKPNEDIELNFVLKTDIEQIGEVVITQQNRARVEGVTTLTPETIRRIPGANPGIENILNTLPGVNSNNELSTQYSVRGGSYDENLVYVNDIQVYRPFLVRSGQQEGLSFVNTDMVRKVEFSAGGFKSRYGDKMSSVLDITYRRPVDFGGSFEASLLGGSLSFDGVSKDKKLSAIGGVRYRDNSLFVNAKQIEANFIPRFADAQTYISYQFNKKFELSFLGNISINTYEYEPFTRQTNFGTVQDPQALLVFYDGREDNRYETYFGAVKASYKPNKNLTTKFITSAFHTKEQEHFDILARYRLGAVSGNFGDENFGEVEFTEGAGSQFIHGRNNLDAFIINIEHLGSYKAEDHLIEWGAKYTREDFRDRLQEYEVIDSAGFSIRPPFPEFANDQPYTSYDAEIEPFERIRTYNETQVDRISGFLQWSYRTKIGETEAWANAGVRSQVWTVNGENLESVTQQVVSPRAQVSIKPNWKKDMVFRLAGGYYHQPPFYRELRDSVGVVNANVKAQQSIHLVAGNDYSFKLWNRPFKLISEAYYKDITNLNPFTIENVRIRYRARNDARAYAYGLDLRLNGEFVPGTESWVSMSYLKTEEKQDERGFFARPTDQRLKFAILFQDYIPKFPKMKLYLNMVYNTGLPGGSPRFADPFLFQNRLPDYQRVDVGFNYALVEEGDQFEKGNPLGFFKYLSFGVEVFNMFDRLNSITNTFVRDASTGGQFAIPNFLSPRVFNVKMSARF
jgi:hypothetical protein